jgi:hypothetical protein
VVIYGRSQYETYDGHHAVWFEQGVQVLQKLEREEGNGLGAAREHVVDDVVEAGLALVRCEAPGVGDRVLDDGSVLARELEVLGGKLIDDRV